MKIIIGSICPCLQQYLDKHHGRSLVTDKVCNLKHIKREVEIVIPCHKVLENGLVSHTSVVLDELLITLNVKAISYYPQENRPYIEQLGKYYGVPVIFK